MDMSYGNTNKIWPLLVAFGRCEENILQVKITTTTQKKAQYQKIDG